jgi:hypothetical protein
MWWWIAIPVIAVWLALGALIAVLNYQVGLFVEPGPAPSADAEDA